ncbi:zinc metallopeptidase [Rubrobacter taiwanensis]|uniref:Zinc metallopeptidase n=2 Tax=Rubrobacter taiwanensis TaxID=185139 RepID=A0A4V2NVS7_9ACTN|nr:zinc metallopeptidase [Rubrobacter taiwanensis]TCJ14642.1 zinc metallopeptidase [Rubrobacter taiwanensis]
MVGAIISGIAALWVRSAYSKYSKVASASGLTGAQAARMILDQNGLGHVKVEPVAGQLTDHYDPGAKAVRLSESNYNGRTVAGVSVAAHECGHAIQDATGYLPMKLRAGLFPIVNFGAQLWFPLFFMGIILGVGTATGQLLIQLAIIAFAAVLLFHIVTLPVEINASTRAYGLLTRYGILGRSETEGTRRVLTAAAFTYIAAALTALLTLLYLILISRQ